LLALGGLKILSRHGSVFTRPAFVACLIDRRELRRDLRGWRAGRLVRGGFRNWLLDGSARRSRGRNRDWRRHGIRLDRRGRDSRLNRRGGIGIRCDRHRGGLRRSQGRRRRHRRRRVNALAGTASDRK
jgi:hypothetical protein